MKTQEAVWEIVFFLFSGRLARRFVVGKTINDAIKKAKELETKNIYSIINILGEQVKDGRGALDFCRQYIDLVLMLAAAGPHGAHIAVKPSQLGLDISEDLYKRNLRKILEHAEIYAPEMIVEIDREEPCYSEAVLRVSLDLAQKFSNQRLACQANMAGTPEEIRQLVEAGISIRLCKGTAYVGDINNGKELRKIFLELAFYVSQKEGHSAIATHDPFLIDKLTGMEKQVLLGIENKKMIRLAVKGAKVGFYLPVGRNWRPYGKRRGKMILRIWFRNSLYRIKRFFSAAAAAFLDALDKMESNQGTF